jgi:uncharacterized protein YkwD
MIRTLLHRSAATAIVFTTFLSTPLLAHAQTMTLPEQFQHPGLTFNESLSFDQTKKIKMQQAAISFVLPQKMSLKKDLKQQSLEKIVLAPTLQPQPTPTIFLATAPTEPPPPTPTPTKAYTPTPENAATTATPPPTATQAPTSTGGLSGDKLFSMSNAYRQAQGLAPFEKDERACTVAATRAPQINGEVASGTMHAGMRAMNLPYWNSENIISMNSEDAAFNWWVNDPIHHDAIVGAYKYSCVACSGNACAQEFTNFQPK